MTGTTAPATGGKSTTDRRRARTEAAGLGLRPVCDWRKQDKLKKTRAQGRIDTDGYPVANALPPISLPKADGYTTKVKPKTRFIELGTMSPNGRVH